MRKEYIHASAHLVTVVSQSVDKKEKKKKKKKVKFQSTNLKTFLFYFFNYYEPQQGKE